MIKLGRIDLDSLAALELQPSTGRLDAAASHFTDFADRRWRISGAVACAGRARVEFCA